MAHRRKLYVIYPPNYVAGDGYEIKHSRFQAIKYAFKLGVGSGIVVCIQTYPGKFKGWDSSQTKPYGEIIKEEQNDFL